MKKLTKAQARKELVKALRSEKYKQAKGMLCDGSKYCCLGVACEVYNEFHVKKLNKEVGETDSGEKTILYDGKWDVLPKKVANWLGISYSGELKMESDHASLLDMNDNGKKFSTIANAIENGDLELQ